MTRVYEAIHEIFDPKRILPAPVTLVEEDEKSTCKPVELFSRQEREFFAVRLHTKDYLPYLAQLSKNRSVQRLPDYFVFVQAGDEPNALPHVLISELKSGIGERKSGGSGADAAAHQIRLGVILAEYLLRLAWVHSGATLPKFPHSAGYKRGLVICDALPPTVGTPKGTSKPKRAPLFAEDFDQLVALPISYCPTRDFEEGCSLDLDGLFP